MEYSDKKHKAGKKSIFFLLIALIFILTSVIYERGMHKRTSPDHIAQKFQEAFLQADEMIRSITDSIQQPVYFNNDSLTDIFLENEVATNFSFYIFKYKNNHLSYWTDNTPPLSELYFNEYKNGSIIKLSNGIYYYQERQLGKGQYVVGLVLIKQNFPYQNIYLENRFHSSFPIPRNATISLEESIHNIHDRSGEFICSIHTMQFDSIDKHYAFLLLVLYAIAFLAIAAAIYQFYLRFKNMLKSDLLLVVAYSIDILILRTLMFFFKLPSGLYDSPLFKPGTFAASDVIPSLGDFFFNSLTLIVTSYVLFITYRNIGLSKRKPKLRRYFLIFSLFLHIFIFYRLFLWASESLIMDSSYSMNLNQIFFLTTESFLALFTITLLLFSFFLVSYRILGLTIHHAEHSAMTYFSFFIFTTLVFFLVCYLRHDCQYLLFIPLIIFVIIFYFLCAPSVELTKINFSSVVIYLFMFSILGTVVLSHFNDRKESEQRKLLAIQLASGEDPLSEYIFNEISHEMQLDTALQSLLSIAPYDLTSEDLAIRYIEEKYLDRRLNKYDWMVTICTPGRSLIIQADTINCKAYFNGVIEDISEPAYGEHLYKYDNELGMSNYISDLEFILNNGADTVYVYIELFSFFIPGEGLGYPELLIDEKIRMFTGLDRYSYAMYKDGKLIFKYGEYPYRTNFQIYKQDTTDVFFNHNNHNHFLSKTGENEHLLITLDKPGMLEVIKELDPFTRDNLHDTVAAYLEEKEIGMGQVMIGMRLCLVGSGTGPDLFTIMEMIGKEETMGRIQRGINTLG